MEIPIEEIKVKKRIRYKDDEIESLAESIKKFGLLNPVILSKNKVLIAGYRRLEAVKLLGKETIYANIIPVENELTAFEIEIEENTQRKQFTEVELISASAKLKKMQNPNFFMRIINPIIHFFKRLFVRRL